MKTKKLKTTLISILVLCCLALTFIFAACGKNEQSQNEQTEQFPLDQFSPGLNFEGPEEGILTEEEIASRKFFSLRTAFNNGWLSHSDLETIAHGRPAEKLDAATEDAIKEAYAEGNITKDDVFIDRYYGTFNGCVVVMISDAYSFVFSAAWEMTIDGVTFKYFDSRSATVYKA